MQPHHAENSSLLAFIPFLLLGGSWAIYRYGTFLLAQQRRRWPLHRTLCFSGGLALVALALLPGLAQWAHHDLRGHMVQHLLIGMLAPLLLVLGRPLTLALMLLPQPTARRLSYLLGSRFFHLVSHPLTAALLNVGGMYALYLTPLYLLTQTYPGLHHLVHLHFLLAGYLFTWSIAGPDPAPRRPAYRVRLTVVFFSIAAHAYLSKLLYAYELPTGGAHPPDQIRQAAQLMYYGGDFTELLLVVMLFAAWYRQQPAPGTQSGFLLR